MVQETAGIDFTASDRKSKKLLVARQLTKTFGDKRILDGVDVMLTPGMRLGLIGPNGSGKTTLLQLFAGKMTPDRGEIERAEDLQIVYFDQNRAALDPTLTLKRTLVPQGDTVIYRDRPIHVDVLGETISLSHGPTGDASQPAFRRRAGPHPYCASHASVG